MHQAEDVVADLLFPQGLALPGGRGLGVQDDPDRQEVVDLLQGLPLPLHFLPDGVKVLGAPGHLKALELALEELVPGQGFLEEVDGLLDQALPGLLGGLDPGGQAGEGLGVEVAKGKVLQLPLELAHPQAVGEGGVDLQGFLGDPLLLLGGHVLQGAEVVQAVRQLDNNDAHVLRHGDEHLAEVLRPPLLPLEVRQLVELADLGLPLHDAAHRGAEAALQLLGRYPAVLQGVVEEACGHRVGVHLQAGQNLGHGHGVGDVGLPASP